MDKKFAFIKLSDLMKMDYSKNWKITDDGDFITIIHDGCRYEIEKTRCDTPKKVCHWVCHLAEKNWVTPDLLRALILKSLGNDVWYW